MGSIIHAILDREYDVGEGTAAADPNLHTLSEFYVDGEKQAYFVAEEVETGRVLGGGGVGQLEGSLLWLCWLCP